MSHLLLIPRIEVNHYNVMVAQWLISPTPVVAINMFTHNLERKVGCKIDGVSIIHHDFDYYYNEIVDIKKGAQIKYGYSFQQRRGSTFINQDDIAHGSSTIAMQPIATGRMVISLVLNVVSEEFDYDKLEQFLYSAKIAGGHIVHHGRIPRIEYTHETIFNRIKTGFVVNSRSDLISQNGNQIESLLDAIRYKPDVETPNPNTWVSATTLGYVGLTKPIKKLGARNLYHHMFVEPLVGLIQYVSVRQINDKALAFWKYKWNSDDKTFICTQSNQI